MVVLCHTDGLLYVEAERGCCGLWELVMVCGDV